MAPRRPPKYWREYGEAFLFALGAAGAMWEIFFDQTRNWYVFALIIVLVRTGQNSIELLRALR